MAGTPGRSGGKRPGAGRPVASRTLRTGQQILVHETTAEGGFTALEMVSVQIVSCTQIKLCYADGRCIVLGY
jgi:hypothetical protein